MPSFSVVIPTYNRKLLLPCAVQSVLAQGFQDFEVIVVDDGSTDQTISWLNSLRNPRVKIIRSDVRRGPGAARNLGIKCVKGKYLAFLDSDDCWHPQYLQRQYDSFAADPNAVLSATDGLLELHGGARRYFTSGMRQTGASVRRNMLMDCPLVTLSSISVRYEALSAVGGFREDIMVGEDRDLYVRLASCGNFIHVPEALIQKRQAADNLTFDYRLWLRSMNSLLESYAAGSMLTAERLSRGQVAAAWKLEIAAHALGWGRRRLSPANLFWSLGLVIQACLDSLSCSLMWCWSRMNAAARNAPTKAYTQNLEPEALDMRDELFRD